MRLSVDPTAAAAGTEFIVLGDGLKAGDTITYTVTGPGGLLNKDVIQLDKSQTAFRLSLSSAGAPAGLYTVAFTGADGQALGSVTFTVR